MPQEKKHFLFLVAVHAFFIKDGKILLLQRAHTNYMDGFFSVPAGHVDGGENIFDALKREVIEEIGITITSQLSPVHVMHRLIAKDEERIDYFFLIEEWSGVPSNIEDTKCSQLLWSELTNLPDKTIPYIRFALSEVMKKNVFSEFDERNS